MCHVLLGTVITKSRTVLDMLFFVLEKRTVCSQALVDIFVGSHASSELMDTPAHCTCQLNIL
jgi:hypothetical protein